MRHRLGDRAGWDTAIELQAQIVDELRIGNRYFVSAHGGTPKGQFELTTRPGSLTVQPETVSFSAFTQMLKE